MVLQFFANFELVIQVKTISQFQLSSYLSGIPILYLCFDFIDEVMNKIIKKEVFPDIQRMKMNLSLVQIQVFDSGFDFDTKIETRLCLDTIHCLDLTTLSFHFITSTAP